MHACAIGDFVLHTTSMREVRVVSGTDVSNVLTSIDLTREPFGETAALGVGAPPSTR